MVANAVNGSLVLLQVRTATGPDVFTTVGGQRGMTVSWARNAIDTSAKDDLDETYIGGRRGSTLSMEGLVIAGNAGRLALISAHETGDGTARIRRGAIGTELARQLDVVITGIEQEFPDDDASTWSVDLQGNGAWTAII